MKHFLLLFLCLTTNAKVMNYETTRTKSTAGTGVGSILLNEATITNPAPMAFFRMGSIYIEKFSSEHSLKDDGSKPFSSDNLAIIASDSSKNLKGSISYIKTKNSENSQKQFNIAFASLISKSSSMGIAYKSISKTYKYKNQIINKKYKIFTPGVFHAINNKLSLGIIVIDPLRKVPTESKVIAGVQYQLMDFMTFMLDAGADYKHKLSDKGLVRTAIQLRVLSNVFIRFGAYEDKGLKENGSGFGVGWVSPKFVLDFALRNISVKESELLQQDKQDIKESSFSASIRF